MKIKVDKNLIIVGVLVLLILISVVQTVQLIRMKGSVSDINPTAENSVKSTTTSAKTGGSGSVPTNLQNLPGMVGGC